MNRKEWETLRAAILSEVEERYGILTALGTGKRVVFEVEATDTGYVVRSREPQFTLTTGKWD